MLCKKTLCQRMPPLRAVTFHFPTVQEHVFISCMSHI